MNEMQTGASPARFAAFSFVDRITRIEGLSRVTGQYTIPQTVSRFPASLVAEAIGQLAAWVAMQHTAFARRPVAALAGETRLFRPAMPGERLDLEVDIESCDEEAIVYRGRAFVEGQLVLELLETLGSMLETTAFDEPERLAADFACLIGVGRAPGAFQGVAEPVLKTLSHVPGQNIEATLYVPEQADFFADHFPAKPVYPATLLLDALMWLAAPLAQEFVGQPIRVHAISNVKVRAFTSPGESLTVFAQEPQWSGEKSDTVSIKVGAKKEGRNIAAARLYVKPLGENP
jgi:3-hydroxymyristoyl/3-hydroxydecanoyl-(acyl carrier protein) dehydratase